MAFVATRPFPWGSLDAVRGADVQALGKLRRWAERCADLDATRKALEAIVGAPVDLRLRRVQRGGALPMLDDGVAVLLSLAEEPGTANRILVEADGPLAASLVALALKRPPPKLFAPGQPASPHIAGAFGAVLVAAVRRAGASAPLLVLEAGPSGALARKIRGTEPEMDSATMTVTVGIEAFVARVTMPSGRVNVIDPPWTRGVLSALGRAEIALPLVASVCVAPTAEVASLSVGDAWMPSGLALRRAAGAGGDPTWAGPVWLAAPDAEMGVTADLGEGRRLVIRGQRVDLSWSAPTAETASGEPPMRDNDTTDSLLDALGEAPVVVRVEIGTARMRARDWAALAPGDVVALGRRVAEPVVLRVGGAELARGELVEIDGQVGVRILSRARALLNEEDVDR